MRRPFSFLGLCAVAGLAPPALGQVVELLPWPSGNPGSGPFSGATMAKLSGDHRTDVVVVSANHLVQFDAAAVSGGGSVIATTGNVNDVATLTVDGQAVAGDRDLLVLAASDGLWTMKETATGPLFTAVDTTSAWQNAKRVVVADLDNDGDDDLLVLLANGRSTDAKIQQSNGTWANTRRFEWTAASDVKNLAAGEFNANSVEPELVINDQAALRILSAGGTVLSTSSSVRPDLDSMALVRRNEASETNDRVAWFTAATATPGDATRYLFVIDLGGAALCFTTSDAFGAMAAGRFNDDTSTDLAVMRGGESALWLFPQQTSGGAPFQYGTQIAFDLGGSGATPAVRPCVGDLGGDRYDDFVVPLASTQELALVDTPAVPQALTVVNDFTPDETCSEIINPTTQRAHVIARLGSAGALASDPTWFVESLVYRLAFVDANNGTYGTYTTTPVSYCRKLIAEVLVPEPNEPDDVEIKFYASPTSAMYVIQTRLVKVESGAVTDSSPAIIGAFDKSEENIQALLADGENHPSWTVYQAVPKCGTTTRIAGFIRIRRMPPPTAPSTPPSVPYGPPAPGQCQ